MADGSPGFTQPDPAPVSDAPDAKSDAGMVVEEGSILDVLDDSVSCTNCAHYQVCTIIAGLRPQFENWQAGDPDDEPPIDPVTLAVICRAFHPMESPADA